MNQEQAENRIEELQGFYGHLGAYVTVNIFLMVINLVSYSDDGEIWFFYPLLGWGIAFFTHAFTVLFGGENWKRRKMQELTGWSTTQDELERLSERTDNLIAILSSVNWEDIDPELTASKENLLKAKSQIVNLKQQGDSEEGANNKQSVVDEIERLEKFVTSNKFSYYDKAANK